MGCATKNRSKPGSVDVLVLSTEVKQEPVILAQEGVAKADVHAAIACHPRDPSTSSG